MELTKRWSLRLVFVALLAVVVAVALTGCAGNAQQEEAKEEAKQETPSATEGDGNHMLSQVVVTDAQGTVTTDYTYDDKGNLTQLSQNAGGQTSDTIYTYNDKGDLETMETKTVGVTTMKRTYEAPVTSGDTITTNWTLSSDNANGEPTEESFTGTTSYTTADNGARCTKFEETTTFNDGNKSIVSMDYNDKGLITAYHTAIEGPDTSVADVTYDYKMDGTSGTVTVTTPNGAYEMNLTCDEDGHPTLLENQEQNIKVEFVYDASVPDATTTAKMMSQADMAMYFTNIPLYFTSSYVSQVESMLENAPAAGATGTTAGSEGEIAIIDGDVETMDTNTPEEVPTQAGDVNEVPTTDNDTPQQDQEKGM